MGKPTRFDWPKIRAAYEAGRPGNPSISALAARFSCSRKAIQKRIDSEGWKQDLTGAVDRATEAKVAGVVATRDPQKTQQAIDEEAARRAAVVTRHRQEWTQAAVLRQEALDTRKLLPEEERLQGLDRVERITARTRAAFEKLKLAKITAEITAIQQAGERKAWGFDKAADPNAAGEENWIVIRRTPATKPARETDRDDEDPDDDSDR